MTLYRVNRHQLAFEVDRKNSEGQARVMQVSVGKATGPTGPGTVHERISMPGDLIIGIGLVGLRFGRTINIAKVYAEVPPGRQPVGADAVFDVDVDGTTIFTNQANRPRIADGTLESVPATPGVTLVPAGARVTVDVDQVGTLSPGSDAMVTIEYY